MDYRFYLDTTEIEEPIGWADFELSMKRDDVYHGMQFEVSTSALRFFGAAATYLQAQKELNGLNANVTFTAEFSCEEDSEEEYSIIVKGRLNFGKYKDTCGDRCIVDMPFEEEGCKVTFRNRFDQKVDVDKQVALDNVTPLPDYTQLGQIIEMPAKALQSSVDGNVVDDTYGMRIQFDAPIPSITNVMMRPDYGVERYNNILTGQLIGVNNCISSNPATTDGCDGPITPQLLFEDDVQCFDGNFEWTSRKTGLISIPDGTEINTVKHRVFKWDAVGNIFTDGDLVSEVTIYDGGGFNNGPLDIPFDSTMSGTTTIPDGHGFYAVIEVNVLVFNDYLDISFYPQTQITIDAVKLCPPSEVEYYMVHETLSRVVEAITNKCMRVKSAYYGRIDSQPFAFDEDGCGSLRMLTSGLKLRRAPDGKFFVSAKDLISGLNAIDNIGFSIETDTTIPGRFLLSIEPVEHFYQDFEILSVDAVAVVNSEIQESLHYAKINVGYKKWEVEQVNGLNEFNSNREYRTNIETVSTALDITSVLVAGSYPIEITRQQTFAETGAEDTSYDNETFIVCLMRSAYDFVVEQDVILNDSNIFDPATVLNYRISPIRNLMRWFKSIANSYPSINSSQSKLFFNSGTGNFIASGLLDDATDCRMEANTIAENADLFIINFANQSKAIPLFKNETASFEYPLSIAQYNSIKSNPYGYVSYTCGSSTTAIKGYIKELKFRPARGMANFTLRKKWL